ncbi:MAG TPA: PIN domain-containing protein [Rhodospirillaceae bacterium]|nr:PIN domain-containing protein [Rhodospirillaceae bacterium]
MNLATFTALLDACVLYPAPIRDLLVHLAKTGLYRAKWTDKIHDEWIRNLLTDRPDLTKEQLNRTRVLMDKAVLNGLVHNYEDLIQAMALPDPDDRHVLAAAIRCRADVIVTYNLKDFPENILNKYDIQAQHPDEFISHLIDLAPGTVCFSVKNMRETLKNPPYNISQMFSTLEELGLVQTVSTLRDYAELL